jgi:LysR family transcriptional regulator, transcription activator of glutamate synthase operon
MTIQGVIHDVWSFDVETDVLRWFKLVADGATVTEVSDLEPVTQSGVSRALARLEAEVGTPLLQRSGRTLTPTLAGEVFRPYADGILQQLTDGLAAVAQFVSPDTGTVAIAFQQSLGSWLVPDLVRSFRADHPGVRYSLTEVDDELRGRPLGGGRTDLEVGTRRFRTGREATRPGDLPVWTRQIGVEPLRLALPRDHRLAGHPRIALKDVAGEPFIGLRPTSALRELGDELCLQAGFRPAVVFEGDDLAIVRGLVAAGLGVAIVPAPRAESPEASPGPVRYAGITDDGAQRAIYLTWPADRPLLPAADLFRKHVLRTVIAGRIRPVSDFT